MTRTFLVEISDVTDAQLVAEEIEESLKLDGISVVSVKPWLAPTDAQRVPLDNLFSSL
jgi:hypothetical protein